MQPDPIVVFYSGGTDGNGRTLREILGWSDATLEGVHDYIQWVFPTRQPSGVNPFAPLVTAETVRAFAARCAKTAPCGWRSTRRVSPIARSTGCGRTITTTCG